MTATQTQQQFLETLASKAPVPGGGGASAVGGALGAALGQMVANLTIGKKRYADVEEEIIEICTELCGHMETFLKLADQDAEVFAPLAQAYGMPKDTPEQILEKERVMELRLLDASLVPLHIMEVSEKILKLLDVLADKGSRMAVSDVGVAVQFARTALLGAVMNVYINTKSMKNREKAAELNEKAERLVTDGVRLADEIYERVTAQLR